MLHFWTNWFSIFYQILFCFSKLIHYFHILILASVLIFNTSVNCFLNWFQYIYFIFNTSVNWFMLFHGLRQPGGGLWAHLATWHVLEALIHLDSVRFWNSMAAQQVNKQHADPCFGGRVWFFQIDSGTHKPRVLEISMIDWFEPVATGFDFCRPQMSWFALSFSMRVLTIYGWSCISDLFSLEIGTFKLLFSTSVIMICSVISWLCPVTLVVQ
jgi:hypothetical protein